MELWEKNIHKSLGDELIGKKFIFKVHTKQLNYILIT